MSELFSHLADWNWPTTQLKQNIVFTNFNGVWIDIKSIQGFRARGCLEDDNGMTEYTEVFLHGKAVIVHMAIAEFTKVLQQVSK